METFTRLLQSTGCSTLAELAKILNIRQSQAAEARRRRYIPPDWLNTLRLERGINPEWILYGREPAYLRDAPRNSLEHEGCGQCCQGACPARAAVEQALRLLDDCPARRMSAQAVDGAAPKPRIFPPAS